MGRVSPDEVCYWYERIQEWRESAMTAFNFCKNNNLEHKKFTSMLYRIEFLKIRDPIRYEKLLELNKLYVHSPMSMEQFSIKHEVKAYLLSDIATHVRYVEIINIHNNKELPKMNFIPLPTKLTKLLDKNSVQGELVTAKNCIELIILKGVKVVISPEVESKTIMTIIELLKDL